MSAREILSDDEVDSLLDGIASGEVATGDGVHPGEVREYEFGSQDHIVRGQLPTLELIHERFARAFRVSLYALFRREAEVSAGEPQMVKYADYVSSLFVPANMNLVGVAPLSGTALFNLDAGLVCAFVDAFFGGAVRPHPELAEREFTATDLRVVRRALALAFEDLRKAWEPVLALRFQHKGSETNPHFASIASPSEIVVATTFRIEIDGAGGELHVTLPYAMIEPFREQLTNGVQSDRTEQDGLWADALRHRIQSAEVELTTVFADKEITLGELLALRPGQVVPVEIADPILSRVEDVALFSATFGVSRGNLALKVLGVAGTDPQ